MKFHTRHITSSAKILRKFLLLKFPTYVRVGVRLEMCLRLGHDCSYNLEIYSDR
jgi:hypothetical protein